MFSDVELIRIENTTIDIVDYLKLPTFYSLTLEEQQRQWRLIKEHPVVSAHRQFGFDFNIIEPVKVVSIKVNQRKWLYNRVKEVHYKQRNFAIDNPILQQLRMSVAEHDLDKVVEADYKAWTRHNILESDDILDFEILLDDSIYEWCQQRNLKVNKEHLEVIRQDYTKYQ